MIGKIFNNRYKIIEKLGSGGTSIVYKGQDLLLNRMVTVKILREEYASNADFVRRFRHEAQAVASLSHSNIVAVYDVGFEEQMHYIVMEFVEGESLKDYIRRKGVLPAGEACNIISQILAGVQHAHEHGIIHRDLKSHNILLSKEGRAKVTDFGIAVGMSDVTLTYNTSSRIMGSVHYISPEQVQGQAVTEKSDIYSVGVIFYEMLTGRLPFLGETPISIAMQHVQGELVPPHQLNPKVSMGISYVVMRAMRKNSETRYDNAREMADAVRAAYEGENPEAAPVTFDPDDTMPRANLSATHVRSRAASDGGKVKAAAQNQPKSPSFLSRLNGKRIGLIAGGVVALILLVWGIAHLIGSLGSGGAVPVPYVVGDYLEAAQTKMEEVGLTLDPSYVTSDEPAGMVISQNVEADTKVTRGRTIGVTVSQGEETVEMPLLEGATRKIAELTLSNKGFTNVTVTEEFNDEKPKDEVILQSPVAGTKITMDTKIELVVSMGSEPEDISMPSLLGLTLDQADPTLVQNNFQVTDVKYEESYEYSKGLICGQSILPGVSTKTGSDLVLTVSNGPGPQEKTRSVSWQIPADGETHQVIVKVEDNKNSREVYNNALESGSYFNSTVTYYGSGTLTILVDGVVVSTEALY